MSMVAGARAGARVALQQLRSPTPFFSRAQLPPPSSSSLTPSSSRGFASDHHGPARVNIWEDPLSPSKWKEEHFVFVSLGGWGLLFYGGYKAATGGKKKAETRTQFVFVSLAGWFSLFYGGYKAATGQGKPKPASRVEAPPKAVPEKGHEKPVSKKDDHVVKSVEKPAPTKKEENSAPKKNEAKDSTKKKEEKPSPKEGKAVSKKEEGTLPKRKGERSVPKAEGDMPKGRAERPTSKGKEDKTAESNTPKDKKAGYQLVKADDEVILETAFKDFL